MKISPSKPGKYFQYKEKTFRLLFFPLESAVCQGNRDISRPLLSTIHSLRDSPSWNNLCSQTVRVFFFQYNPGGTAFAIYLHNEPCPTYRQIGQEINEGDINRSKDNKGDIDGNAGSISSTFGRGADEV
jgi:hypothetical protein